MKADESQDSLLTNLCGICHINPLKYKCPRCGIETCSLPCVKRHKVWSQCSGIRNPAAYRKRAELATSSSVDQDFNFITSVERSLQKADDDATERGIPLDYQDTLRIGRSHARLNLETANSGAIVLKAPIGMSRSKQNKSHWDNRHSCLMWTVEWILPGGRQILANSQATKTIEEAFRNAGGRKGLPKKRKFDSEIASSQADEKSKDIKMTQEHVQANPIDEVKSSIKNAEPQETVEEGDSGEGKRITEASVGEDSMTSKELSSPTSGFQYYLHRPNTPANVKCLIPLKPELTIAEVLRDRLVIEFPTIYARFESPDHLLEPFISEANYDKQHGEDSVTPFTIDEDRIVASEPHPVASVQLDENKILEVLEKDSII